MCRVAQSDFVAAGSIDIACVAIGVGGSIAIGVASSFGFVMNRSYATFSLVFGIPQNFEPTIFSWGKVCYAFSMVMNFLTAISRSWFALAVVLTWPSFLNPPCSKLASVGVGDVVLDVVHQLGGASGYSPKFGARCVLIVGNLVGGTPF